MSMANRLANNVQSLDADDVRKLDDDKFDDSFNHHSQSQENQFHHVVLG